MDATAPSSNWPLLVSQSVDQLADPKIYTFNFTYTAYNGHPKIEQHKQMAEELIQFIKKNNFLD